MGARTRRDLPEAAIHRQREQERRAFARFRFHPDPPSVAFDDSAAYGQPDSGSFMSRVRMQPLEQAENLFLVAHVDSDSVVAHAERPFPTAGLGRNPNLRRPLAAVFYGV